MAWPQADLPQFHRVYFPHTHSQAHSDGPDFVCAARIFTRLPGFRSTIPGFQLPAQISPKQPGFSILTAYDAPDLPTRQQFHYPIPGSHSILPGFPRHVPGFSRICPDLPGLPEFPITRPDISPLSHSLLHWLAVQLPGSKLHC